MIREKAVRCGRSTPLAGVLSEPVRIDGEASRPGVLLLNSGILHRVGACRQSQEAMGVVGPGAQQLVRRVHQLGAARQPVGRSHVRVRPHARGAQRHRGPNETPERPAGVAYGLSSGWHDHDRRPRRPTRWCRQRRWESPPRRWGDRNNAAPLRRSNITDVSAQPDATECRRDLAGDVLASGRSVAVTSCGCGLDSRSVIPPIEHPERSERDPATRRTDTGFDVEVHTARIDAIE